MLLLEGLLFYLIKRYEDKRMFSPTVNWIKGENFLLRTMYHATKVKQVTIIARA
jgi:hypothetical protein